MWFHSIRIISLVCSPFYQCKCEQVTKYLLFDTNYSVCVCVCVLYCLEFRLCSKDTRGNRISAVQVLRQRSKQLGFCLLDSSGRNIHKRNLLSHLKIVVSQEYKRKNNKQTLQLLVLIHSCKNRIESASPVLYFPIGSPYDRSRSGTCCQNNWIKYSLFSRIPPTQRIIFVSLFAMAYYQSSEAIEIPFTKKSPMHTRYVYTWPNSHRLPIRIGSAIHSKVPKCLIWMTMDQHSGLDSLPLDCRFLWMVELHGV